MPDTTMLEEGSPLSEVLTIWRTPWDQMSEQELEYIHCTVVFSTIIYCEALWRCYYTLCSLWRTSLSQEEYYHICKCALAFDHFLVNHLSLSLYASLLRTSCDFISWWYYVKWWKNCHRLWEDQRNSLKQRLSCGNLPYNYWTMDWDMFHIVVE